MDKTTVKIENQINDLSSALRDDDYEVLVAYVGEFSKDLVNSIPESIELKLKERKVKKNNIKRVFSLLIEGLQNIRKHSDYKDGNDKLGFVYVGFKEGKVKVLFGNLVNESSISTIDNKMQELQNMGDVDLKDHYRDRLTNGLMSDLGGAGLGLITMVLKSKNSIDYNFKELKDDVYLYKVNAELTFVSQDIS